MKKFMPRNRKRLVNCTGYVSLSEACVRANKTGFFALQQRVAPESFDSKTTDINPSDCFFGGRRIDLALAAKRASDFATKSADVKPFDGAGASPGEGV